MDRMEDVRYEILHVRMRKNMRGLGLSITGGSPPLSSSPHPPPQILSPGDGQLLLNEKKDQNGSTEAAVLIRMIHSLIRIRAIYPSEPAADAGLAAGDFLLQANDQSMIAMTSVVSFLV